MCPYPRIPVTKLVHFLAMKPVAMAMVMKPQLPTPGMPLGTTRARVINTHSWFSPATNLPFYTPPPHEKFLSRLQRYTLDAMGPMIWLLDQLDQGKIIDPKAGKGAIKASISLLSNASAHFNLDQRKALLKYLKRDLQLLAEG